MKTNFFALAFLAMGTFAGITSCGKDGDGDGDGNYTYDNIEGTYIGTHYLKATDAVLDIIQGIIPEDPETNETIQLKDGFIDTLTFAHSNGVIKVTSALLDITVDGKLVADNTIRLERSSHASLALGTGLVATEAFLQTSKDVKFNGKDAGSQARVELRIGGKIAAVPFPLDIPTDGTFTKVEL